MQLIDALEIIQLCATLIIRPVPSSINLKRCHVPTPEAKQEPLCHKTAKEIHNHRHKIDKHCWQN